MRRLDTKGLVATRFGLWHNAYVCGGPHQALVDRVNAIRSGEGGNSQPPTLDPHLEEVMTALASHAPKWEYFFPLTYSMTSAVTEMYIMFEGETLGWVRYSLHDEEYNFDNKVMSAKRERGQYSRTKSAAKVVSELKKHTRPSTIEERMHASMKRGASLVTSSMYRNAREHRNRRDGVLAEISEQLFANWETVVPLLDVGGTLVERGRAVVAAEEEYDRELALYNAGNKALLTVLVEGNYFLLKRERDDTYKRVAREDAPEEVRTSLGLLRLSPVEEYVSGVGARHSDNEFTIIFESELEDGTTNTPS